MGGNNSVAARVSLLLGVTYVAIGIIGFFSTGFSPFLQDTNDTLLFGFASINPLHNMVHILTGSFLLIMTRFSAPVTEGALMGVGLFYVVAFVIGVAGPGIADEQALSILSMHGAGDGANFLHLLTGVVALLVGLSSSAQTTAEARRTGLPA